MNHVLALILDRSVTFLGALPALIVISLILGVLLAIIFGWISPQARVRAVKHKISATILEAILYRHDTRVSLAAQARLLRYASWYLLLALPPILVLALPTLFFMGHLNELFGYRMPTSGERIIVQASAASMPEVELVATGSLIATPTLHLPAEKSLAWRLDRTSAAAASVTIGASNFDLSGVRLSPLVSSSWWKRLLYPATAAPALPSSLEQVSFSFPARSFNLVGHEFSWITIFLIVSLISGYMTARIRGIAI